VQASLKSQGKIILAGGDMSGMMLNS